MILRPYLLLAALFAGLGIARLDGQQSFAGSSLSKSAKPEQHPGTKPATKTEASEGSASDQNPYRNAAFGFRYNVIVGWVDRTKQMQPSEQSVGKGQVLLAVFERPPEASGETVNSAVVIAQESSTSYPGLKNAADYVGPLTELVTSKGFKVAAEPSEITIDGKTLVRCDFTRELVKVTMYQSTLIFLQKGTIVSFTFIGSTADEVEHLIDQLSFQRATSSQRK